MIIHIKCRIQVPRRATHSEEIPSEGAICGYQVRTFLFLFTPSIYMHDDGCTYVGAESKVHPIGSNAKLLYFIIQLKNYFECDHSDSCTQSSYPSLREGGPNVRQHANGVDRDHGVASG